MAVDLQDTHDDKTDTHDEKKDDIGFRSANILHGRQGDGAWLCKNLLEEILRIEVEIRQSWG